MSESASPLSTPAEPAPNPRARARLAVTLGGAFTLLCAAIIGFDMPNSFAEGGLFDEVFGGGGQRVYQLSYSNGAYYLGYHRRTHARQHGSRRFARAAVTHKTRYARAQRRRLAAQAASIAYRPGQDAARRPAVTVAAAAFPPSRRFVCVRSCDGYYFPLARQAGAEGEASCAKLCPGAETKLYVMPAGSDSIEGAVSARGGGRYAALLGRTGGAKSCSCNAAATAPEGTSTAYLNDSTLRPGDTVVTPQGVRVLRSGSRFPYKHADFLSLADTRDVSLEKRGALAAIERAFKTPHGRLAVIGDHRKGDRRHKRELRTDQSLDMNAVKAN